ncbi:hypothetical protein RRG08_045201 [Elysia crispata]|uniref:Uncharacterized protein n=1 Tax=Elysia crispata TaxID=231223 RepID=A0AAE1A1P7_9GAST|nr:hypothetical protein RRG08_045201 [Elysia crispata]
MKRKNRWKASGDERRGERFGKDSEIRTSWTGDRCFMLPAGLVVAASCFPLDWLSLLHTYSWTGDRYFMLTAGLVIAASCLPLDW